MKTVGQPILAAASFQAAFRSRLKAGRSQDWLPHLFCLLLSGCAYVGEPLPPALNIPRRVPAIVVEQVGSRLTVQFELPLQTTETLPLQIESIELRAGPVDPGAWPAGAQPINTTRSVDGKTASASAELTPWVGKRIIAGVRVQSKQGKWSEWSPLAPLDVIQPLAPPADVKPEAVPEGVRLSWRPGVAMRIERRSANGTFTEAAMVEGAEWIDKQARFGEEQQYRLTAMSGKARSETFTTPGITPQDAFAPAVPGGLTGVAGLGSIELSWERPADADLAGFRVYRATGTGEFARVGPAEPVAAASFSDRTVQAGVSYRYAVSSVDQIGNESPRSQPVAVTAPN